MAKARPLRKAGRKTGAKSVKNRRGLSAQPKPAAKRVAAERAAAERVVTKRPVKPAASDRPGGAADGESGNSASLAGADRQLHVLIQPKIYL
jgi:hypothetical protein